LERTTLANFKNENNRKGETMNRKMTSLILMASIMGTGLGCWGDDTNATGNNNNPVQHPVNAYTNHEVKADMKDSKEYSQKAADAKAAYTQAKSDYEKSLKDNGVDSQVTKDAKERMHKAHKEMRQYNKKTAEANKDLRNDEIKAHQ
jgi:hypothetical protein